MEYFTFGIFSDNLSLFHMLVKPSFFLTLLQLELYKADCDSPFYRTKWTETDKETC